MFKTFMSTVNELTDRKLCSEAAELHNIFIKLAALTEHKVRSTLNLANPDKNPSEHERNAAASRIVEWLRDKNRVSFTNNELANYIILDEFYSFPSHNALGGLLSVEEVNVLSQLVRQKLEMGKGDEAPRSDEDEGYSVQDIEHIIDTILKTQAAVTQRLVMLVRSSGSYSDAYIASKVGSVVSFVVPVSEGRLGYKEFTLEELKDMGMVYNASTRKVIFG